MITVMKASKSIVALALFAGLATLSFAGPGAEYWTRTKKAENDQAKSKAPAQVASCATCACCADMKKS